MWGYSGIRAAIKKIRRDRVRMNFLQKKRSKWERSRNRLGIEFLSGKSIIERLNKRAIRMPVGIVRNRNGVRWECDGSAMGVRWEAGSERSLRGDVIDSDRGRDHDRDADRRRDEALRPPPLACAEPEQVRPRPLVRVEPEPARQPQQGPEPPPPEWEPGPPQPPHRVEDGQRHPLPFPRKEPKPDSQSQSVSA